MDLDNINTQSQPVQPNPAVVNTPQVNPQPDNNQPFVPTQAFGLAAAPDDAQAQSSTPQVSSPISPESDQEQSAQVLNQDNPVQSEYTNPFTPSPAPIPPAAQPLVTQENTPLQSSAQDVYVDQQIEDDSDMQQPIQTTTPVFEDDSPQQSAAMVTDHQLDTEITEMEDQSAPSIQSLESASDKPLNIPVQPVPADQPQPAQAMPSAGSKKILPKILLTAGPLFLVASLAISLVMTNSATSQVAETYIQENADQLSDDQWVEGMTNEQFLDYAPYNPDSVQAYSDSSMTETLTSDQPYNYPNPYFTWEAGYTVEPGANIIGYNIYFGQQEIGRILQDHPLYAPTKFYFSEFAQFSPEDFGITLESGVTYHLYVQSVSDGQADGGYERTLMKPSKIYFTYQYE